jgi:hypothetical protein
VWLLVGSGLAGPEGSDAGYIYASTHPSPPLVHPPTELTQKDFIVQAGSLKMNTALEYSTRVVQEGGRRCKKSTLYDLVHLTLLRIPLMNPPFIHREKDWFTPTKRIPRFVDGRDKG